MPDNERVIHAATCLGCGCTCDDIDVVVRGDRIASAEHACALGIAWFGDGTAPAHARIAGRDATEEQALDTAAQLLRRAIRPLIYLAPDISCEAQAEAIAIADALHASLDTTTSATMMGSVLAAQERGRAGATLGEIRNRADLVLFWGVDPILRYPRYWSRYAPEPVGLHVPNGRRSRTVVAVDVGESRGPDDADLRVTLSDHDEVATLVALRALVLQGDGGHEDKATKDTKITKATEHAATKDMKITKGTEHAATKDTQITKATEHAATKDTKITKGTEHAATKDTKITKGTEHAATKDTKITKATEHAATKDTKITKDTEHAAPPLGYSRRAENTGIAKGALTAADGGPWSQARVLAQTLVDSRYVVLVADAEVANMSGAGLAEALIALSQALNGPTRCALSLLRAGGNRSGADAVATWQTGYPSAIGFARGYPSYRPHDGTATARLRDGEVDALLIVGSPALIPAELMTMMAQVPCVVIGPRASESALANHDAVIDTGLAGIHEGGTAIRMDDVPVPLRAVVSGPPPAAALVRALGKRLPRLARTER